MTATKLSCYYPASELLELQVKQPELSCLDVNTWEYYHIIYVAELMAT